ncbi:hypothetical protein P3T22_006326, partial [Paraburkholderia sp. GAS348]
QFFLGRVDNPVSPARSRFMVGVPCSPELQKIAAVTAIVTARQWRDKPPCRKECLTLG